MSDDKTTLPRFAAVQRDLAAAHTAQRSHAQAMIQFQAHLLAGDWESADAMRPQIVGAVEAYLDNMLSAHRAIKEG